MVSTTPDRGLTPGIRKHLTHLSNSLHVVDGVHRAAATELSRWIIQTLAKEGSANVIVICTANSRRSVLGSVMGNISASFNGIPRLSFYSGGTIASACNDRTVLALEEIGVVVSPTDKEAPRGESSTPNPIFSVHWGSGETLEFSKVYNDTHNPQSGFAALLVCTEADHACPSVSGARLRIPCPFTDPKESDGTPHERLHYAAKRDEIGRFMLMVTSQVANRK